MTTKSPSMKAQIRDLEEQVADYERDRALFLTTARRKDELAAQLYGAEKDRDYYRGRAERAEARVAELEAALDVALDVLRDCARTVQQDDTVIAALAWVESAMARRQAPQ